MFRRFLAVGAFLFVVWWVQFGAVHGSAEGAHTSPPVATASPRPQAQAPPASAATPPGRLPFDRELALGGHFTVVPGHQPPAHGGKRGRGLRYRVDVENGLAAKGLDGGYVASFVHRTLNDPRSWSHEDGVSFERVSGGRVDFVVTLASPGTVDAWCAGAGLDTSDQTVSCDAHNTERVMVNAYRWAQGSPTYGDDMLGYRQMVVNHEVGHRIGHGHELCAVDGASAPVMMQQTKTLTSGTATCRPNPWPHP
ncbi:DUF3152 domain-containing protein [Streptomyces sp. NPDC086554]|uniref:DUF3152 domain-containing protein n=1 Tax=Streptomyces sp. NPDC086554 TaxID=3154864 RepID=UPI0034157F61